MEKEKPVPSIFRYLIPIVCTISLTCYLIFSRGLRYLLSEWEYIITLFKMVFAKGILEGLPSYSLLIPNITNWHYGLLLLGFLSSCLASAWLAHSVVGGRRFELVPHLILFSLATAIVPTLLLATLFWPDGRGHLTLDLAFYSSLTITIGLIVAKRRQIKLKTFHESEPLPKNHEPLGWAWIFLPPMIAMFGLSYLRGVVSYSVSGYDTMFYHLPLAGSWLHNASITRNENIQFHYPGNTELMFRWGFINGSEKFVFVIPFFITLLCIYMIYKLGRLIGQGRQASFVAACCASTVPLIPFLASTAYTDTMGVLFLLLSVFFIVRWVQSDLTATSHLFCSGLAAGLAAGTKLPMLNSVFAITVVAALAGLRSRHAWRTFSDDVMNVSLNWPWLLTRAGIFFLTALLGSAYWYLRNVIEYGNPFYPVSILGLPGLDIHAMVQMPALYFGSSLWKRILYPWTEITYFYPFDDGIGAVVPGIIIPSFLLWLFMANRSDGVKRVGPGVIFLIACISLIMFAWSGNMQMRYGIFPILLCFIFMGEIWKKMHFVHIRTLTFVSFLIMSIVISQNLTGGYLYQYLRINETRYERLHVPDIVDLLPPSRIFNAAASSHTLGLMGSDYQHDIISLFREPKPEDIIGSKASYVLLTKEQEEKFRSELHLERVGSETRDAHPVSLWKIVVVQEHAP